MKLERRSKMISGGVIVSDRIPQQPDASAAEQHATADDVINQIRDSLRGLRFGSLNIIVQDGVIIQIERTEKRRIRNHVPLRRSGFRLTFSINALPKHLTLIPHSATD